MHKERCAAYRAETVVVFKTRFSSRATRKTFEFRIIATARR